MSNTINTRAKNKIQKLYSNANETFRKREVTEFFKKLDLEFKGETAKVLIAGKAILQLGKALQRSNKRKKIEENIDVVNILKSEEEGISTNEYLTNDLQVSDRTVAKKKLVKVGNEIVEEEITLKISPPLNKVEVILNKYREALENSTDEEYVELDSVFINYNYQSGYKFQRDWLRNWVDNVLTCFQLSRHVLNDESSMVKLKISITKTKGIYQSFPEIGDWYHDGIITININSINEYIGILEVVGNTIVKDHEQIMCNNRIDNEKQLQQDLETFDILVDKCKYNYDGVYLVDETDLSFVIPNTLMQLCLLKDIIKKYWHLGLARVQHLNTKITELLKGVTSQYHSRRITTIVNTSPDKSSGNDTCRNSKKVSQLYGAIHFSLWQKIIVEFIENKKDEISSEFVTKLVKEIADETFNKAIYPTQDDFKKISESVAKKNYREIFNTYSLKKWNTFYVGRIMANLLKKHRQLRGTAASTYRKALFSIFGEKELPYIQSTDDHNVIATWKASPQVRKIYGNLFERIPNSETTYIDRVLKKTCNADTPIHQKAFAIVTCENFLNPKLPNIISKEKIIKPLLLIFEEQIKKGESLHREVNHSTESEDEDDEDEEAFINEEE
ncbi:hypothetical protein Glove_232g160 [Diversispora epigaea]|uniref:Uncharacterized protein n=1 Tax=Diversispora epigaea TaxID=1348612 RepID=A0A397IBH6_9GLOM|nr:hypothetical protein Glove_232g160 [Diversispora epigaea]